MDLGLKGRAAVVTGSSGGIGRAVALALAAEGARVTVNGRNPETVHDVVAEIQRAGGDARPAVADVTTPQGCVSLMTEAEKSFGRIDVLVNNVGGATAASVMDDDASWEQGFAQTVWPALRMSRLVAPEMRARRDGVIVMIASVYGRESGGRAGYQVAKSAEISLARAMATELAPYNVRVLSVAPGSILFPGGSWWRRREADPEGIAAFMKQDLPLGRFGELEEVASVVTFLCSPRASLVTGACIPVDGAQGRSLI